MSVRSKVCLIFVFLLLSFYAEAAPATDPDVVVITIDTLRADRVGCYGYSKGKTPTLDAIAKDGILFRNAVSHVPLTRPSHISIFTGLFPFQHNVHDNVAPALDSRIPVLAEILRKRGYSTAAFVASFVVNSQSGLQRGFDVFEDQFDPEKKPTQFALNMEKRADQIHSEFASWQATVDRSKPYFSWIHLYDPHFPYDPPDPFSRDFQDRLYDGEVAYTDYILSKILKLLRPDTLLIVTSDHGESLGDHGENAHSFFIYDSTLQIPLLLRWTGKLPAGHEIKFQTRLVDLFPTILDLLNIRATTKTAGISLKPWLSGANPPAPDLFSYCETFTPWLHFGWSRLQGLRSDKWKYIEAPKPELYDLHRDPKESRNLYSRDATPVRELRNWLHESGALKSEISTGSMQDLDPETLEKLASLGYAGVPSVHQTKTGNLADPKDKIADFRLFNQVIREGIEAFQSERYTVAAEKFQILKNKNIPSFEVHYYLGRSYLRLKSYDKARTELELALQKLPHFLPVYKDLAEAWEGQGKKKEAESALLAGLTITPNHPTLVQPLAWFYQKQKNYAAAEKLLVAELRVHPDDLESRYRLGAIYRDTGRTDAAIQQFREIIARRPGDPEAHNQLGMIFGATKRIREAIGEFETASKLDPKNKAYQRNLERVRKMNAGSSFVRFRLIQAKTKAVADVIHKKLERGEPWEALSKNYSIHPSSRSNQPILELSADEIDPAIAAALSKLKAGEFSAAISTKAGFFLVKKE